jgi:hypothetical protein
LVSTHPTYLAARGLWQFEIPEGLIGAQITSAVMHVSRNSTAGSGSAIDVDVYALTAGFDETTDTWNTLAGGDYDAGVVSSGTLPAWTTSPESATIDLTALLQGNLAKVRDNGILMKVQDEAGDRMNQNFATKEDSAPSFGAYLEIAYNPMICPVIQDVYIDEGKPDDNFADKTRVLISGHPTKGAARGLWQFDIPEELEGSLINSAVMHVSRNTTAGVGSAVDFDVYALNAEFDENSDTWNSLIGGNYDPSVVSSGSLPAWATYPETASIDLTTLLQDNFDKVRDYGILMKVQDEASDLKPFQSFASKEDTAPSFGAYLEITEKSTLVTLSSFEAVSAGRNVIVQWVTETEIDNAGFNLFRSVNGGEYEQINDSLIPAAGVVGGGAAYEFVDVAAPKRFSCTYKLQDIDFDGTETMHGPVRVIPRALRMFR